MNTIIATTDFSKASLAAVNYAARLAELSNSVLVLFHSYHVPLVSSEVPMVVPSLDEMEAASLEELQKIENDLYATIGKHLTIEKKCVCGFALEEIETFAANHNADLVVMGMRGAGLLEEKLIGSLTTSLIKKGTCTVLAVEENMRFKAPSKILLATDYSAINNVAAYDIIKDFIKLFKSEIFVLNVVPDAKKLPDMTKAVQGVRLDHILEGIKHSFFSIEDQDVTNGINNFANQHQADLVVMVPGNHSFVNTLFNEGNTKRMAFHSTVPLLTLKK